jgi:predicted lipoprotein with Yx(FWY)xxD motif
MTRTKTLLLLLAAASVLVLAACGGSDNSAPAASIKPMTSGGKAATVGVSSNGDLGKILVDSKGRTVYLFRKDTGPKSTCSGACASEWPPVTTSGKPTAGKGLSASKLGTTKRSDGTTQVTYNGHPVYLYAGDHGAGDVNGQGLNFFGGLWYAMSPSGNANTGGGSSSGGRYSY